MLYRIYCRLFQAVMKAAMYLLPWHTPQVIEGAGSVDRLPEDMKKRRIDRVLVVTGPNMLRRGLLAPILENMADLGIEYEVFDRLTADPDDRQVEEGVRLYHEMNAQGLLLFGGGSPMDCGKAIAARIARPDKSVRKLQGVLKVRARSRVPMMWAVPTTSGTGSEATMAAVITDSETHRKKSINDISLIPHVCVLDPELTVGLPPEITANTGMDALSHAVEAYINGTYNTPLENRMAKAAVKLIYENLYDAYLDGKNIEKRQNMQRAAFYAGRAFTRGCVGYVHSIGHAVGGFYGVPHGRAMAILLPHVLKAYGKAAEKRLAELADYCGISSCEAVDISHKAKALINWIENINRRLAIPAVFDCIMAKDVEIMARWAQREANPLYPVPVIFNSKQLAEIINRAAGK